MSERRPLGPLTLLALGVNGIVGVGIFVAPPTVAAAFPGGLGAIAYVLIAIGCLPVALAYARLARAMPEDGGPALYAERAFGRSAAASVGALVWLSALFSTAAVTRALADRFSWHHGAILAVVFCVALAIANVRGLRLSAVVWTVLTVAKLAPLLLLATAGLLARAPSPGPVAGRTGPALLAIMFALQGFEIVPLPAGQVNDPDKNVPRATVASLIMAGALYAAVHLACARALPDLAHASSPIPQAAAALGGARLAWAVAGGVLASMGGITVGMHAMTPRYLSAIAAHRAEASAGPRTVIATGVMVALLCLFSSLPTLVDLSSVAVLAQYASTSVALLVLSLRRREGLAPRDAWPVPFALVVVAVLLVQAPPKELGVAAAIALVAILVARRLAPGGRGTSREEAEARPR